MAADQRICRPIVSGNGKAQINLEQSKVLKSNGLAGLPQAWDFKSDLA
jgi:hypothetical protein